MTPAQRVALTPTPRVALEPVEKLIELLRVRCSWLLMKSLLSSRNLKPGGGWPDLKTRVAVGDNDSQIIASLVRKAYLDSIVAGNRYVQLYQIDASLAAAIASRLSSAVVAPTPFSVRYPLPLVGAALDAAPKAFSLCEIAQSGSDFQLVFCSRQIIEESLLIDGTSTPIVMSTFSQALSGYDKFVAYRRKSVQVFDVLTVRTQLHRIEISLDITQKTSSFDAGEVALNLLFHAALLLPELQPLINAQHGVNLFPAIADIYNSAGRPDTAIVDIGFRTPSGATNRGKMPTNSDDIREELFHKNGAKAVDKKINLHGVVVNWRFSFPPGAAKVKLWTTAAKAMRPTPYVWGAEITEAAADSDIVQAVNKLTSFL
jgi:hypothetical protein